MRVAAVLGHQFETVFYARSDLLGRGDYGSLSKRDMSNLRSPFFNLERGLDALSNGASADVIGASQEVLVGAREFRPPGGPPPHLGAVRFRFCYVVLGTRAQDLRRYVNEFHSRSLAGREIWEWLAPSVEGEDGPLHFYATYVVPSHLIVSNDIDDLERVWNALLSSERPSMDDIPAAELVSRYSMWGFRRARHDAATLKILQLPAGVESMLFLVDTNARKGMLRVESVAADRNSWLRNMDLPPFTKVGPKAWESVVPLTGEKSLFMTFDAVGLLGFAIFL
jgi:hypothetical protein